MLSANFAFLLNKNVIFGIKHERGS